MDEIQRNFIIGVIEHKIEQDLKDHESQVENAKLFIETYGKNLEVLKGCLIACYEGKTFLDKGLNLLIENDNIKAKFNDITFEYSKERFIKLLTESVCYLQEYLPLGSIVKVDGKIYMIEQRMVQPKNESYYHDYRLVPYPTGIFNESMYAYAQAYHIEEVIFKGYDDDESRGYELAIKESLIENNIYAYYFTRQAK